MIGKPAQLSGTKGEARVEDHMYMEHERVKKEKYIAVMEGVKYRNQGPRAVRRVPATRYKFSDIRPFVSFEMGQFSRDLMVIAFLGGHIAFHPVQCVRPIYQSSLFPLFANIPSCSRPSSPGYSRCSRTRVYRRSHGRGGGLRKHDILWKGG